MAPDDAQPGGDKPAVRVIATVVKSRRAFVEKMYGPEGVQRLLAAASQELREALEGPDSGWVDYRRLIEASVLIDGLFGRGDLGLVQEMGKFSATYKIGAWRAFMMRRVVPPSLVMGLAGSVWRHHYDAGRIATRPVPRGLIISVLDFPAPHRVVCLGLRGWIEGLGQASAVQNAAADEISCRLRGAASCEFKMTWD